MKKIIFVNNTAAINGGALTVLRQFLEEIKKRKDESKIYYFFVTADLKEYECKYIKIIDNIEGRKMIDRIKWDNFGVKAWAEEHNIKPDLIISLQNIAVNFKGVPQIIYYINHYRIQSIQNGMYLRVMKENYGFIPIFIST